MGQLRRLIVFDLDGTLIDSRRDLADSANALIAERGGHALPLEAITRMVGGGAALLVQRAFAAAGLPLFDGAVERFLELYDGRLTAHTRPYDGIPRALDLLAPLADLAVLTNKPIDPTRKLLAAFGFDRRFSAVLGGDGPFPRKPDPASLEHLMKSHAAGPSSTVMVGDSRVDYDTARAAGTRVCMARFGFGFETFPVEALRGDEGLADDGHSVAAVVSRLLGVDSEASRS